MALPSRETHIAVCNVTVAATYSKHIALKMLTKSKHKCVPVHVMKATGGIKAQLHSFLITALNGCEWAASFLGHCTPRKSIQLLTEYQPV